MFNFETHMDFVGQYRAELMYRIIVTAFGVGGFWYGWLHQSFFQTFLFLCAGFALAAAVTMPPWPFYRRHPLKWLKPIPGTVPTATNANSNSSTTATVAAAPEEKSAKKKKN